MQRLRCLVASRSGTNCQLYRLLFERGHYVLTANSLQQFETLARQERLDLVVIDADTLIAELPGLIQQFGDEKSRGVHVVGATQKNCPELWVRIIDSGCDDYLWTGDSHDVLNTRLIVIERSAQKRAVQEQQRLRLLHQALDQVAESFPQMLIVVDEQGKIHEANHGPRGESPNMLIGRVGFEFLTPSCRRHGQLAHRRAISRGEIQDFHVRDVFDLNWDGQLIPFLDVNNRPYSLVTCWTGTGNDRNLQQLEQFRHAAEAILESEENWRETVAQWLHQEVAQQLAGTLYTLAAINPRAAQHSPYCSQFIEQASEVLQSAIRACRDMAGALVPLGLRKFGLRLALETLLNQYAKQLRISTSLTVESDWPPLPYMLEMTLFRIVERILSLAVVHPESATVHVWLGRRDTCAILNATFVNDTHLDPSDRILPLILNEVAVRAELYGAMVSHQILPGRLSVSVEVPLESEQT